MRASLAVLATHEYAPVGIVHLGTVRGVYAGEERGQYDRADVADQGCQAFSSEIAGGVLSSRVALEQGMAVPTKKWNH